MKIETQKQLDAQAAEEGLALLEIMEMVKKAPDLAKENGVKGIFQTVFSEGIKHIFEGHPSILTIGVINKLLEDRDGEEAGGFFTQIHQLKATRSTPDKPSSGELVLCSKAHQLFKNWFVEFVYDYYPEAVPIYLVEQQRYLNLAMDRVILEMRNRLYNEKVRYKHGISNRVGDNPALQEAKNSFKNMSKPSPEGTVKELAAKYGKSLSEIRRLKKEGRLHELSE